MVDLQLPSPHGGSLFDTMRELTDSYVVGIAPPGADNMRIRALRAGADDVVSTPVNPDELAARCQALQAGVLDKGKTLADLSRNIVCGNSASESMATTRQV